MAGGRAGGPQNRPKDRPGSVSFPLPFWAVSGVVLKTAQGPPILLHVVGGLWGGPGNRPWTAQALFGGLCCYAICMILVLPCYTAFARFQYRGKILYSVFTYQFPPVGTWKA